MTPLKFDIIKFWVRTRNNLTKLNYFLGVCFVSADKTNNDELDIKMIIINEINKINTQTQSNSSKRYDIC